MGRAKPRWPTASPNGSWRPPPRAQTDGALAHYQGAVLDALQDTEGSMIIYGRSQARRQSLELAVAASDKAADLARQRFRGGLIDFLEVLDAERTALNAELLLSQPHRCRNLV